MAMEYMLRRIWARLIEEAINPVLGKWHLEAQIRVKKGDSE